MRTEVQQDLAPAAGMEAGGQGTQWGQQAHFLEEALINLCFK